MTTIRTMIEQTAQATPDQIAFRYYREETWHECTYGDYLKQVRLFAEYLGDFGLTPRQSKVAILMENSPEWLAFYAAAVSISCIVVPLDPKLTESEVAYILKNSEAELIISDKRHEELLNNVLQTLPVMKSVLILDCTAPTTCAGLPCYGLAEIVKIAAQLEPRFYDDPICIPGTDDLASLIYTSGTTGFPKGAMLSHGNFISNAKGTLETINTLVTPQDNFLLILPLFHAFAFTTNFIIPMVSGSTISFVRSMRTIGDDIRALSPSVIMAVPLLVEKLYAKIAEKLNASCVAKIMLKVGLDKVVGKKVRASLGGKIRLLVVGGAKCPQDVLINFNRLGIAMVEGYGLTEASPVVAVSPVGRIKIGAIGPKIGGIDVQIKDPDAHGVGELQVKGPIVMQGYYKNPEATAEAFEDGWLCTGDLVTMDDDGYITICGRKKALIVNREGKNIYPEEVEQCICRASVIADVCVLGYRMGTDPGEKVGVIVSPDREAIDALYKGKDVDDETIRALLKEAVQRECVDVAAYKHPRKIVIKLEPLVRTSTQKVRRCVYKDTLDE